MLSVLERLVKDGTISTTQWDEHFKSILLMLIETFGDSDVSDRPVGLLYRLARMTDLFFFCILADRCLENRVGDYFLQACCRLVVIPNLQLIPQSLCAGCCARNAVAHRLVIFLLPASMS